MDTFNFIFIIVMTLGFSIIIFYLVKINQYDRSNSSSNMEISLENVKKAIDQADLAIDDLNLLSEEIFKRFNQKQKEILFLYEAIENKKELPSNIDLKVGIDESNNIFNKHKSMDGNFDNKEDIIIDNIEKNQMLPKINELLEKGLSVSEIAKSLNMGQGEVKLIIDLGKDFIWEKDIYF